MDFSDRILPKCIFTGDLNKVVSIVTFTVIICLSVKLFVWFKLNLLSLRTSKKCQPQLCNTYLCVYQQI